MRTTEEALISVPDSFREGSFGLGAGRLRTVFHIVLPSAVPGILSGVILAIGRVVGESAALMYTAGSVAQMPGQAGGGFVRFRANPLRAHVCAFERGPAHRQNVCHSGCAAGYRHRHQRTVLVRREENYEETGLKRAF